MAFYEIQSIPPPFPTVHRRTQNNCVLIFMFFVKLGILIYFLIANVAVRSPYHNQHPFSFAYVVIHRTNVAI